MSKSSKYQYQIEQVGSLWRAQITRQVTSKKTHVSKEKIDFKSESDAKQWAENELLEFSKMLASSNRRHADHRKESEEIQRLRSARRAEKTKLAKQEKANNVSEDGNENIESPEPLDSEQQS